MLCLPLFPAHPGARSFAGWGFAPVSSPGTTAAPRPQLLLSLVPSAASLPLGEGWRWLPGLRHGPSASCQLTCRSPGWAGAEKRAAFRGEAPCPAESSAPPRVCSAFHRAAGLEDCSFLVSVASRQSPPSVLTVKLCGLLPCPAGAGAGRPEGGCQGLAPGPSPAPLAAHLHARHPSSSPRREGRRARLPL